MSDNETIPVNLPEIPGFKRYEIGDIIRTSDNAYCLGPKGLSRFMPIFDLRVSTTSPGGIYCRRIEPENPPLPSREDCERWGMEYPTVCDVPTEDNCDAWIAYHGAYVCHGTVLIDHSKFGTRRWLLRKKQVPLSFETWQGPLNIKARRKSDGTLV